MDAAKNGDSPLRIGGAVGNLSPALTQKGAGPMSQPTSMSVYRYYDAHDVLVYVGITSRGIGRNREHNGSKSWWKYVTRQEVEHFPDRMAAHAREVDLIRQFSPPFNVQHNPSHIEMRAAYGAMVARSVGSDPLTVVRLLGKSLPLVQWDQDRNFYVFRTEVEHSSAARLLTCVANQSKVVLGSQRVGHVQKVEICGPFALIHSIIRSGCRMERPVADIKVITAKPIMFRLHRIRLVTAVGN